MGFGDRPKCADDVGEVTLLDEPRRAAVKRLRGIAHDESPPRLRLGTDQPLAPVANGIERSEKLLLHPRRLGNGHARPAAVRQAEHHPAENLVAGGIKLEIHPRRHVPR